MSDTPHRPGNDESLHAAAHREWMGFYRFCQVIVFTHYKVWHQMTVIDPQKLPQSGGVIIAANHQSHLDPPLLGVALPRVVHNLAKEELFHKPFLKWFLPAIGQVPVAREGSGAGMALKTGARLLRDGKVLGVFPEGTRSKTGERQKARTGVVVLASMGDVPILPAYIWGTREAFPPKSKLPIPFRPIGIRYGDLIHLTPEQKDLRNRNEMERTAEMIMDRIFDLAPPQKAGVSHPSHG